MVPARDLSSQDAEPKPSPVDGGDDFAALFLRAYRALWLVAVGAARNVALAEDILQEAAIVALSKFETFQPGTNFTAWMSRIVQFVAQNQNRRHQRRQALPLETASETQAPIDQGSSSAFMDIPRMATGQLPPDQQFFDDRIVEALGMVAQTPRICLLLRTIEGLEYSAISAMLGIPEGTAMSHVHRTRRFLRERLADMDPTPRSKGAQSA